MITSHDVARLAGVSQPTVSRALRDQAGVSPETRARVLAAARALGYVASEAARALSTRRSYRVGIVTAELSNPFYPALLEPLQDALGELGYRTIQVTDRGEQPVEIEPLIDGSLDGVVLTTSLTDGQLPHELVRRGVPIVFLNRYSDGVAADACVVDNRAGAARVADLLVDLGHRRIGAVLGPSNTSTGRERAAGFRDRLAERGVSLAPRHVWTGPFSDQHGRRAMAEFLELPDPPTALFCGNDVIAVAACNVAHSAGIAIPEALTIVGFDDIPMASWEAFALTTMRTELPALAKAAAELLVRRIEDPDAEVRRIVFQADLIERGTHGPPRKVRSLA